MRFLCAQLHVCLMVLGLIGCGPLQSEPNFQGFGEADLERDAQVLQRYDELRGDEKPRKEVRVLLDTIPEGIKLDGGQFSVEEGYQHQIVGKFALAPQGGMFYFMAWFHDYEDGWRKGLCYWQVPLEWLTLGIWTAVPTAYPCFPTPAREKLKLQADAKALAEAAGADTVIMGWFMSLDQKEALGAAGLLIKLDPRMKDALKTKPFKPDSKMLDEARGKPLEPETRIASRAHPKSR